MPPVGMRKRKSAIWAMKCDEDIKEQMQEYWKDIQIIANLNRTTPDRVVLAIFRAVHDMVHERAKHLTLEEVEKYVEQAMRKHFP